MHANQPIESRPIPDSLTPDPSQETADAAWRAEVASRVNSYRSRRKRSDQNAPALDFGPAAEAQSFGPPSPVSQSSQGSASLSQSVPARSAVRDAVRNPIRNASSNAIDTNYYRRLNAESMAQDSSILLGETHDKVAAATAPAQECEAESGLGGSATAETMLDAMIDAIGEPDRDDPALDLEIRPAVAADSSLDRYCISAPPPEPEQQPAAPLQGNLIVFPRPSLEPPLLPQPSRDELAEPMNRRPRILEVPEDIMPVVQGSLFPEIRLDADVDEHSTTREPEIEVPLRVAPLSARLVAGVVDWGVAAAAGLLFAALAWRALPGIPHAKPFWMGLVAVTLLLWAVYQHLFLLYAGRTVGMRMNGIRLSTFDGQPPQWLQRRRRARYMVISFAAVTLGFLWALADEDALCWHDRISRTFPTVE